jgi:ankyrin repeat protein
MLADDPALMSSLTRDDHARLSRAIFDCQFEAAGLMLRLGFDEMASAADGGSALHCACWVGHVGLVDQLIARGRAPLDLPDPTYLSPPLGWAALGSAQRCAAGGDYVGVIDRLAAAGADVRARGNRRNLSLIEMADGNPRVQDALRRHGGQTAMT